jgi:outer membrane immunogenic protein
VKKFLLATTAVAALSVPAFAADMPLKAPMMAPVALPPYSWTACYVGGHVGVGWGRKEFSDNVNAVNDLGGSIPFNVGADFLGGGQIGCDYQFASNWVIGIAGDFSWANIEGQTDDPFFAGKNGNPETLYAKTDFLATATGRIGYAWDHYLLYAKGGAAWAHDKYSISNMGAFAGGLCLNGNGCNPTASETRFGWTVGGGFEWAFANNWSTFIEGDYYGFGTKGITFTDPNAAVIFGTGGTSTTYDVKQYIAAVKIGLNYRFPVLR